MRSPGIHHVTAICSDPQKNIDFYSGLLGLRLVKVTVNFDDPSSYHLYYGDTDGSPGTILTFFAWPGARRSVPGVGSVQVVSFAIPLRARAFWLARAQKAQITVDESLSDRIRLFDPDGLTIELIESSLGQQFSPWTSPDVGSDVAIRGFAGVTIPVRELAPTKEEFATVGLVVREEAGKLVRLRFAEGGETSQGVLLSEMQGAYAKIGAGFVHHLALRVPSPAEHQVWHQKLLDDGRHVSPIMDRKYFSSIYVREPGGVLLEFATDEPGFAVDEPREQLGTKLVLPAQFEPQRSEIEQGLPKIRASQGVFFP